MKGYRKILIGLVFLAVGIVILFAQIEIERMRIFYEYLTWLAGIVIAGNGIERIADRNGRSSEGYNTGLKNKTLYGANGEA